MVLCIAENNYLSYFKLFIQNVHELDIYVDNWNIYFSKWSNARDLIFQGENGRITYVLRGSDSVPSYSDVYFYVNPTSGVLYVTKRLSEDTQRPSRYVLSITAFDNGIPQLSSRVTVTVNVIRNRNGPVFSGNSYVTTIDESISVGTSILQVQATDADGVSKQINEFFLLHFQWVFVSTWNTVK